MYTEIFSREQVFLFPLLRAARRRGFYMVGGTAIALHLGHRKSIDFDLFRGKNFRSNTVNTILQASKKTWERVYLHNEGEYHGVIEGVKTTFFWYPYPIQAEMSVAGEIRIPSLLSLAAMKAFALGKRAKWKDYVDLYFIMRDHFSLREICRASEEIFGPAFQSAQYIEQLAYHEDINYQEQVDYCIPNPPTDEEIRSFLRERSLEL